jgi:hypothetical protein
VNTQLPLFDLPDAAIAAVRAPTRRKTPERVRWPECCRCSQDATTSHPWYCTRCWEAMIAMFHVEHRVIPTSD